MLSGEASAAILNLGMITLMALVAIGIGEGWLTWWGFGIAAAMSLTIGVLVGRATA